MLAVIFMLKVTKIVPLNLLPKTSEPYKEKFLSLHFLKRQKVDKNNSYSTFKKVEVLANFSENLILVYLEN